MDNLVNLCTHHHRLLHEGGFQVIHENTGKLTFITPKGNRIQDSPPPVASDKTLESINQQAGLNIDPRTAIPNWHFGDMDLHMAVSGLYDLAHKNALE